METKMDNRNRKVVTYTVIYERLALSQKLPDMEEPKDA